MTRFRDIEFLKILILVVTSHRVGICYLLDVCCKSRCWTRICCFCCRVVVIHVCYYKSPFDSTLIMVSPPFLPATNGDVRSPLRSMYGKYSG